MSFPYPRLLVSTLLVAGATACGGAVATPAAEVQAAMEKLANARSYQATMAHDGPAKGTATGYYVAPDRFRLELPATTQVVIGDTLHVTTRGQTRQLPVPAGLLEKWRDPANVRQQPATVEVQSLGREAVDGQPATKYVVERGEPQPAKSLVWVGEDGRPLQMQVTGTSQGRVVTTTIRYSRYDDPEIRVEAP
jgi:outer membrane lipoprotein-sorting protein